MTRNPTDVPLDLSPADRITAAVKRLGADEVVELATALLAGYDAGDEFLLFVGGRHAEGILDGAPPLYWPELWGARALLHVWNDSATPGVIAALTNQAWRVREMATRVVAERGLDAAPVLRTMLTDDTARVRASAARALSEIGEAADVDLLAPLFSDPEIDVRRGAGAARKRLEQRFGTAG